MIADAAHASELAPSNPIARLTSVVFGLIPAWLPLLVLRLDAGAALLRFRAHALGRLVHAVFRHEDPVL